MDAVGGKSLGQSDSPRAQRSCTHYDAVTNPASSLHARSYTSRCYHGNNATAAAAALIIIRSVRSADASAMNSNPQMFEDPLTGGHATKNSSRGQTETKIQRLVKNVKVRKNM